MTLFQHRRFQFFDLEKVDINIRIKENLKGCQIKCGTSGRGRIILADTFGTIYSISRNLDSQTLVESHPLGIRQVIQLKQSPYLITLGEDELANFSVKIWEELDLDSNKIQLVLKKTIKLSRSISPSYITVHENLQMVAVGYSDGYLQIYRGEILRDRNVKPRALLFESDHGEITGLAFKNLNTSLILFASAKSGIFSFDVTQKDREIKLQNDKPGCEVNCSCYASESNEDLFIVGRNDAVYCYTHEGIGPCYGFEGDKHLLYYFRGYLLIIAKVADETYTINVFDFANKFIAFSSPILAPEPITVAVGEWGTLYLIVSDGTLWQLKEKDLQTKMSILYRKNHYDLAVKVAKCNNFDGDGMADIFRQYGDHLYSKGDLDGAIRQYFKTVGKLEPSYVVRKYLDASRVLNLLEYLEVVHKSGNATSDLTTLLLNCLTKLKLTDKIEHYVKDPSCDFLDSESAIKVFRKGGMFKQAYQLALKHNLYGYALQILLEDIRDPCKEDLYEILEKIIREENAEITLRKYGSALVHLVSKSDAKSPDSWKKIIRLLCESSSKRELVDLFIAKKEILLPLLENICQEFTASDGPIMNLLLEAYLDLWSQNKENDIAIREKILALLSKAPDCQTWDWARALFSCKMFGFSAGEIIAYEKIGLHNDLLAIRYTEAIHDPKLWPKFIETCRKYSRNKPTLWKDVFYLITTPEKSTSSKISKFECPKEIVQEILGKLLEENLMEPIPILDRICQTKFTLGSVRSFLIQVLDRKEIEEDEKIVKKLQVETTATRHHIENIKTKPTIFQGSRCSACQQKLDFPSIHFLCSHSFHQHCFESYTANDKDCPVCWNKNKDILGPELNENKPSKAVVDADFALKLTTSKSNSFSVLSDFFGKGIFKDENNRDQIVKKKSIEKVRQKLTVDPVIVTEGRLRLAEGISSSLYNPSSSEQRQRQQQQQSSKPAPIESYFENSMSLSSSKSSKPIETSISDHFEGRDQQMSQQQNRSNLSSSLPFPRVSSYNTAQGPMNPASTQSPPQQQQKRKPFSNLSITSAVQSSKKEASNSNNQKSKEPKNPFDEEEEDSKNPFLEDSIKQQETKNPFEEDDDYDPNLNPFAE